MLVIAHRGLHDEAPENTLDAFAAAISLGCHGIETDVRASADGEAVLVHDRVTPTGLPVSQLSRHQLQQAFGHAIPTLAEALDLNQDIIWNIEIKTLAAWALVQPLLLEYGSSHRFLVSSFIHSIAMEAARLGFASAFLTASQPPAINTLLYSAQALPSLRHIVWDFEIIDRNQLQQCNALGFRNFTWGACTVDELMLCREYGVHGVITDKPSLALRLQHG